MKTYKVTEQEKRAIEDELLGAQKLESNEQENAYSEPFGPPGTTNLNPSSRQDMDAIIDEVGGDANLKTIPEAKDFLDIGYDPTTQTVQMGQQTFYTKVHYMLSDETRDTSLRQSVDRYVIRDQADYDKLKKSVDFIYNMNAAAQDIWINRIQYLIMQLEYALVCASSRYAAVFAEVGHLELFVNPQHLGFTFVTQVSADAPPYEVQFMQASSIATSLYNAILLRRLEPSDNPDFIALTDADIYHLCNYIVPPLLNLFSIIRADAQFYKNTMFVDQGSESSIRGAIWKKQDEWRKDHKDACNPDVDEDFPY